VARARREITIEDLTTCPRHPAGRFDAQFSKTLRPNQSPALVKFRDFTAQNLVECSYVERLIGSIRRECLDHVVVFNERHLLRILSSYVEYYHRSRTHLSLAKDCPEARLVMRLGKVIAIPQIGGLHHRYQRLAA